MKAMFDNLCNEEVNIKIKLFAYVHRSDRVLSCKPSDEVDTDEDSDRHVLSNKLTMFGMEITILLRRLFLWSSLSFSLKVDFLM